MSGRWATEASSPVPVSSHHSHYCLHSASCQICGGISYISWHSWIWGWDSVGSLLLLKETPSRPQQLRESSYTWRDASHLCHTVWFFILIVQEPKGMGMCLITSPSLLSCCTHLINDMSTGYQCKNANERFTRIRQYINGIMCYNKIEFIHRVKYDSVLGNLSKNMPN